MDKPETTGKRRGFSIFVLYLVLSLLLTLPLATHLTTHLPFGGDAFQTVWDFWWLKKCLSEGLSPFYTTYMFAPDGVSLALHDLTWFNSVTSIPLQWILGNRVLIFNLLWLASVALSGYFMYLYARKHLGDGIPAFAAGCIFTFSTYHLHHGAQLGSMWIGWLPLFQFYAEGSLATGSGWKPAGKAAIVLALAAYTHWYLAAFCIFQLLFTLIWNAFSIKPFPKQNLLKMVFILIAGGLLILPILLPAAIESGKVGSTQLKIEQRERYGADLGSFITPSPRHPLWKQYTKPVYERIRGNITESPIYPGWILYFLIFAAFAYRVKGRFRFGFPAICFIILAFGIKPYILGNPIGVPLPYTLFEYIPGLDFIRVPSRFIAPALVFLSVLGGMGLNSILNRVNRKNIRVLLGISIILLAIFDTTILPLPVRDTTKHSDYYATLAMENSDPIIFDYPAYTYQEYLFFQTIHRKPILAGYGVYLSQERAEWLINLNADPWNAEGLGVGYIIFHKGYPIPLSGGTIAVGEYEITPDMYFNENPGLILLHEDRYIKVFKVK